MSSMATAYGMKHRKKMASGGDVKESHTHNEDCGPDCQGSRYDDLVDRVMTKRMSKGGMVANGGDDDLDNLADGKPREFDDLALRDDLEFSYTADNSGDHLGNDQEDDDRHDIVAMVMKKRKQHNPRPA